MNTQPSLTIISITGHSEYTYGSLLSLKRSYRELRPHIANLKCVLVSPEVPSNLPDFVTHYITTPFNYKEYNYLLCKRLNELVDTDFALLVQDDGWVIDGNQWRDEFFKYDFIGALIPNYCEKKSPIQWVMYSSYHHQENIAVCPEGFVEPLNGGFSLRSKKLLQKLASDSVTYTEEIQSHINEDVFITAYLRDVLESEGFKFPDRETASHFSLESSHILCHYHANNVPFDIQQILGVHNKFYRLKDENTVELNYKFSNTDEIVGGILTKLLVNKGYCVYVPAECSPTGQVLNLVP